MTNTLAVLALMLVGLASALLVLSWRRDWRPSLTDALFVALALRLAMFVIAKDTAPYDLFNDFHIAGQNVLDHQDPTLNSRPRGWSYLPTYAYLLAGMVATEQATGLPWLWVSRVLPIGFDLGVVALVYVLAGKEKGGLRAFQYACTPIAIFVSAVHGQMEPLCLLLSLGAFVAIRSKQAPRVVLAGVLIALAISVKTWPVLFLPALLLALPTWRARLRLLLSGAAVGLGLLFTMPLTVGTPFRELPTVVGTILGYTSAPGSWGWSYVVFISSPYTNTSLESSRFLDVVGRVGSIATLIGVGLAIWWWRKAAPVVIAGVAASVFQVVTPGHGAQYLLWPAPFTTLSPTRFIPALQVAIGLWAWWGYIVQLGGVVPVSWGSWPYYAWPLSSLLLVVLIVVALPWAQRVDPDGRRRRPETESAEPAGASGQADHGTSRQPATR